jgi:spore maturation protein CgeB
MRLFEATGVGCCLLSDTGKNMQDLYETDKELVTYRTLDECLEKVRFLLENDSKRIAIGEAGQKKTLTEHSLPNRCSQLDELLQTLL